MSANPRHGSSMHKIVIIHPTAGSRLPMALCSLMVLGRKTEASLSYLGELDWNEMRSKKSNMISSVEYCTHGYPYVP